jgi:hypothetical protein
MPVKKWKKIWRVTYHGGKHSFFSTPAKAEAFVIKEARKLTNYDREEEEAWPKSRGGPSEYACCKLGATINALFLDED